MRAIVDTCVVVDALQSREPFCKDAERIFLLSADQKFLGYLTAKAMTDIYYLVHRITHNDKATRDILNKLCSLFGILDTTAADIYDALSSKISDFEDAVMTETAVRFKIDCIVTRNVKDYKNSAIPVYSPSEFIGLLEEADDEGDF